jgi:hypothetical protein
VCLTSRGLNNSFYQEDELYEVVDKLLSNISEIAQQVYELWYKYQALIKKNPYEIAKDLKVKFFSAMYDRWGESILRDVTESAEFTLVSVKDAGKKHSAMATNIRKSKFFQ